MGASGKTRFEATEIRSLEVFVERCRSRRLRMGRTRRAVATAITEAEGAFDFNTLWAHVRENEPKISRGTVYLSLRVFRHAGLIRQAKEGPGQDREVPHVIDAAAAR